MKAWVWGVGTSNFGSQPNTSTSELIWTAVSEAMADAAVTGVDAVYVGTCFGEPGVAQRGLHRMGISGVPIVTFEGACASSTLAFHEACAAVDAGRYGAILVVGVEHLTSRFRGAIPTEPRDLEGRTGLVLPALYAMIAARYQDVYGISDSDLAAVAVKNRAHGALNPRAHNQSRVTAEDVLASRLISDPLTLLQCCSVSDGASACVVGSSRRASSDIAVRSCSFGTGGLWNDRSEHVWGFDLVRRTADAAYEASGLGIDDVDVIELHDAFTIAEIVTLEALRLAELGRGACLAQSGRTALGGATPVNPSGGLLSRGHPLGATGTAQIAEIVWQLQGRAGARQVEAGIGLVETMGGGVGGIDGNACVVAILSR